MKLDRGNKDQSPHKKVRSNHELDFRKNRILFTSLFTMIPSVLFTIFWGNRDDIRAWEFTLLTIGSGLIVLGCLYIMFSLMILNKDTRSNNYISSLLLISGGLLYWIGTIGIVEDLSDGKQSLFQGSGCKGVNNEWCNVMEHIGGNEHRSTRDEINIRDALYWFGLLSLIGWDALMLGFDIISDIFFAQYLRISLWSFPLLFSTSFAWGVMLIYSRNDLSWWELTGKAGFGVIAISNLFLVLLSCVKYLIKSLGFFLSFCSFLGSIAIWIYHCAYIAGGNVDDGTAGRTAALYYIGIPFLLSGQSLFLMYDCLLGTKEPKDGAAAHTVPKRDTNPEIGRASCRERVSR